MLCPVQTLMDAKKWSLQRVIYESYRLTWQDAIPSALALSLADVEELYQHYGIVPERVLRFCEAQEHQLALPLEAA